MMHLIQVCNVGNICGGTAACAWTITRALPEFRHTVLCLGRPTRETMRAFQPIEIRHVNFVDEAVVSDLKGDLLLLHNSAPGAIGRIESCSRLLYQHSCGQHAPAEFSVACSRWLAERQRTATVLYQPVPIPLRDITSAPQIDTRQFSEELLIGRICTPHARKWPENLVDWYAEMATRHPGVRWEFVGCPTAMQQKLTKACDGRATFQGAGWQARTHLWRWHVLLYHHPTLTESFGRTVAEAMRVGCVPVVDDRGGFTEQIESNRTGFLCNNFEEFAAAIGSLQDAAFRWKMSRASRQAANDRFSLRSFSVRFRDQLHRVIQ